MDRAGPPRARQASIAAAVDHRAPRALGAVLTPDTPKPVANALAAAARAGILATPGRDDYGRPVVVLTVGAWTRECRLDQVAAAIEEAKALPAAVVS